MKKEDVKEFKNTKRGNKVYPTLNKLFIDGILCILCAIFLIVTTLIYKDGIFFYVIAGVLILLSIYFIATAQTLKKREINRMKIEKKKKEKK
jgi:uncharacterized membrane protein HdeD (DUF308 family)